MSEPFVVNAMHAVVVTVDLDTTDAPETVLHKVTIPAVKALPGFVRGTWLRAPDKSNGRGIMLFDTADNAHAAIESLKQQGPPAGGGVSIRSVEIFAVVGEA